MSWLFGALRRENGSFKWRGHYYSDSQRPSCSLREGADSMHVDDANVTDFASARGAGQEAAQCMCAELGTPVAPSKTRQMRPSGDFLIILHTFGPLSFEQTCCKTIGSSMISHIEPSSGSSKRAPTDVVHQLVTSTSHDSNGVSGEMAFSKTRRCRTPLNHTWCGCLERELYLLREFRWNSHHPREAPKTPRRNHEEGP